jgi:hypothetical protein
MWSMTPNPPSAAAQLSDQELLAHIHQAAHAEREATVHLIALLVELDARRLYLGEGFSSLFTYCTQALHLSEHAAYNRIEAARAVRRFPSILQLVEEGAVTLTAIRLLAPHLTPENHHDVLARARHKSKREVEQLVAGLDPRPDVPSSVRKLPARPPGRETAGVLPGGNGEPSFLPRSIATEGSPSASQARNTPATRPADVKPLAPERYKIQFTVGRETHDMLRCAQDLLRHVVPDGDPAIIFERALTLLVSDLERRKIAATGRPRTGRSSRETSRHIPAEVKRTVWQRDGGRCAFNGRQGRCRETGFLEYHHVVPFAVGGETTAANIELRCRSHNGYEADQYFDRAPQLRESREVYRGKV